MADQALNRNHPHESERCIGCPLCKPEEHIEPSHNDKTLSFLDHLLNEYIHGQITSRPSTYSLELRHTSTFLCALRVLRARIHSPLALFVRSHNPRFKHSLVFPRTLRVLEGFASFALKSLPPSPSRSRPSRFHRLMDQRGDLLTVRETRLDSNRAPKWSRCPENNRHM